MLNIGDQFPAFNLKGVVATELSLAFQDITHKSYKDKWKIYFFWPKDFTFVCPTEIAEFGQMASEFAERDAQLLGISVDSEFAHRAWKEQQPELRDLPFPMLSDLKRELCTALDILDKAEGVAKRAVYIVDPEGTIRFVMVTDLKVGRNPREVLRVLDALQTEELCPCNWQRGDKNLQVA